MENRNKKLEELAAKIDSSCFFSLDPEKDISLREREKNRLIELLYEYQMLLDSNSLEEMGLEFMEVFAGCIKSYVPGTYPFTHYFNVAFKNRKSKKFAEEKVDDFTGGVRMSRSVKSRVYLIAKYLDSHPDVQPAELLQLIEEYSEEFGMTGDELKEAIYLYYNSHAERLDAPISEDDGEDTLHNLIPGRGDFTDRIMDKDHMFHVIDVLEECYLEKRTDAKPVISAYITSMLSELYDSDPDYLEYSQQKEFFDDTVYSMITRIERPLQLNEIQKYLNRTNITNTVKNFLSQVKERLTE